MAASSCPTPQLTAAFLFLLLITTTSTTTDETTTTTTLPKELEATLESLRSQGYTLFTNAISTSDLQYQLLTTMNTTAPPSFTLFAPKDSPLSALDMSTDAASYVSTLRYHVAVANRPHTFSDLLNLSSSPFLETLLPHHSVLIGKTLDPDVPGPCVMVDGVRVSDPDLFIGSRIAVHGIDGILVTGSIVYQEFGGGDGKGLSPAESANGINDWNVPGVGWNNNGPALALTPASRLDCNNGPALAPVFEGNIPVAEPPDVPLGKVKSHGKKQGRRHRRGRRGHRRHSGRPDHRLVDL